MHFTTILKNAVEKGEISKKLHDILLHFYQEFCEQLKDQPQSRKVFESTFLSFLDLIKKQVASPYSFEPYHKQIRTPYDYYAFGLDFLRPLVEKENSTVLGIDHLKEITAHISKGHNVILFANHQIEADPQAISLLLEDIEPKLAEQMIFVAGERVITDPLAVPFSLGLNLLCIYSKRYINHPPEEKHQKQLHNKRTMELMSDLLKEGGKCIYVAPSGGRDRPNIKGEIVVAPFDQRSIEMFSLMAKRAKTPTFFFPLALSTYSLLPPPKTIQVELGEKRTAKKGGIHLAIGAQLDMETYPGSDLPTKPEKRKARANYIYNLVKQDYSKIS